MYYSDSNASALANLIIGNLTGFTGNSLFLNGYIPAASVCVQENLGYFGTNFSQFISNWNTTQLRLINAQYDALETLVYANFEAQFISWNELC